MRFKPVLAVPDGLLFGPDLLFVTQADCGFAFCAVLTGADKRVLARLSEAPFGALFQAMLAPAPPVACAGMPCTACAGKAFFSIA
jgi:hypothetical protein